MTPDGSQMLAAADREAALDTIASAFVSDPAWVWMFETADDLPKRIREVMACFIDGGMMNNSVWRAPDCDSVAIWVPPGLHELTPELEARVDKILALAGGETAERVLAIFEIFESERRKSPSNHYLSIFATRPAMQGKGIGGALLRAAFEEIDRQALPCYLESSNPTANNAMYEHLGFEVLDTLPTPPACPPVLTMWRAAR